MAGLATEVVKPRENVRIPPFFFFFLFNYFSHNHLFVSVRVIELIDESILMNDPLGTFCCSSKAGGNFENSKFVSWKLSFSNFFTNFYYSTQKMQVWEDAMMVALSCAPSKERVVWQSLPIRIMLLID